MKFYIPKWSDIKIKGQEPKTDWLRFLSYNKKNRNIRINWYIPGETKISERLLECNVYEVTEIDLKKLEQDGYEIIEIPLYDTVIYTIEYIRGVKDLSEKLLDSISMYSNIVYHRET